MLQILAIVYGIHLVLLIYGISFVAARGLLRGGAIPFLITLGKYFIYYLAITFGFKNLPTGGLLIGFGVGLYLSLGGICLGVILNERRAGKTSQA